jgi:hypothetical protein
MSEAFDPYRKWLGIPPKDQPPHHYRLLGIAAFEDDPDVIENAAARQMAHLRTYKTSKHAVQSQRLLSEISAAKLCLLSPETKAAYDGHLRQTLSAEGKLSSSQIVPAPPPEPAAAPGLEPDLVFPRFGGWREEGAVEPPGMSPPPVPIPMPPPPIATAQVVAAPLGAAAIAAPPVGVPVIRRSSSAAAISRSRRNRSTLPVVISVVSLLVLATAGGIALVLANRPLDQGGMSGTAGNTAGPGSAPAVPEPKPKLNAPPVHGKNGEAKPSPQEAPAADREPESRS